MAKNLFHPNIVRNRLRTNWVVVLNEAPRNFAPTKSRTNWPLALGLFSGLSIALAITIVSTFHQEQSRTLPAAVHSLDSTNQVVHPVSDIDDATSACDRAHLERELSEDSGNRANVQGQPASSGGERSSNTADVPFRKTGEIEIGGLRVENFSCNDSRDRLRLSVLWQLEGAVWRLKKISQLPLG